MRRLTVVSPLLIGVGTNMVTELLIALTFTALCVFFIIIKGYITYPRNHNIDAHGHIHEDDEADYEHNNGWP